MALILAVDPERTQSDALAVLARELRGHELLSAPTCADALAAVDRRVPDLVLLPILLPEAEESQLLSGLRERSHGRDVRALTIPLLKAARSRNGGSRWFGGGDNGSGEGCEPRVFADLIREYLAPLDDADDHVDASPAPARPAVREAAAAPPVDDDPGQPPADEESADATAAAAQTDAFPLPAYAAPDRRARVLAAAFAAASWARARRAGWKDTPAFTAPPAFVPPPIPEIAAPPPAPPIVEEFATDFIEPAAPVVETPAPAPPRVVEAPPPDAIPAFDHDELVAAIEAAAPPRSDSKGTYASLEDAVAAVVVEPAPPEQEPEYERSSQPEFSHESVVPEAPVRPARPEPEGPSLGERLAGWAAALGGPMKRWAPRVAGLAVLIALGIQGRSYWARATAVPTTGTAVFESMPGGTRVTVDGMELGVTPATATLKPGAHTVEFRFGRSMRTRQITVNAGERTVERIDWSRKPSGTLQVNSTPSGAKVLVDGAERGTTPVTLDDVAAGTHTVVLQSSEGSIKRSVTVKADQTALIDETIYSGWVTLYSPFELTITEGSRPLRLDDRNQVMLPAGPHDLRFENRTFGYSEVKHVDIQPGHGTTLSIAPPKSLLNVSASAPAEVLVDGASIGQTPITDAPIDIGTRDVVVRSTSGEEKRQTITVTTRPVTLTIDFAK